MISRPLRQTSIALAAAMAGFVWAEAVSIHANSDRFVQVGTIPGVPRHSIFTSPESAPQAQRPSETTSGSPCIGGFCDQARLNRLIQDIAHGYGIESALLHAVVTVESRYNPRAVSPNGAAGLMQLMPGTAKRYGVNDTLDPEQNLRGGAKYLRDLLEMFGSDVRLALAAYHAGENAVLRYQNSIPPFRATMEYVPKVFDLYQKYRASALR